jgi:hypothetical protein
MDQQTNFYLLYLFITIIGILISAYLFKLVFEFNLLLKNSKSQTILLKEIAKKLGVEEEKVKDL